MIEQASWSSNKNGDALSEAGLFMFGILPADEGPNDYVGTLLATLEGDFNALMREFPGGAHDEDLSPMFSSDAGLAMHEV